MLTIWMMDIMLSGLKQRSKVRATMGLVKKTLHLKVDTV